MINASESVALTNTVFEQNCEFVWLVRTISLEKFVFIAQSWLRGFFQQDALEKRKKQKEWFETDVKEYETVLNQAHIDHTKDPALGLDPKHLKQELEDNKVGDWMTVSSNFMP